MLRIHVPMSEEYYDEEKEEFIQDLFQLDLEHSLVSLSKWEQFFKKPFLVEGEKTDDEIMYYIQCMVLSPEVPPEVYENLTQANLDDIGDYMNDKATATWFNEPENPRPSSEVLTSELIYYWMFSQGIDKECETWHLQRLVTLLKIFNFKNAPPKKESAVEAMQRQRRLNAERRKQFESPG